ncbi:MAG: DUF1080 domain-containing protein [Catenulispora sp.]|nr:DUF1080 domain-containing protein [Catenulispora sp.]
MDEIREVAGLPDSGSAAEAAEATVGVLAHVLADDNRRRVEDVLPGELRESMIADASADQVMGGPAGETGFVADVAQRCHCTTEQARLRAQATLAVLAHHEPEVFSSVGPPDWFERLSAIPLPDGSTSSPTDDELRQPLGDLPDWTRDTDRLSRRVVVPSDSLRSAVEEVLRGGGHLDSTEDGLTITVRPSVVDTVASYDVQLARQVEEVLVARGAAIARPSGIAGPWSREPRVLFGGKTMAGWRMCGAGAFDLVDSAVQSRGGIGMLWYADQEFSDFLLTLDWRVAHASDIGGVFVRFPDPGADPWVALTEGYEIQLYDDGHAEEGTGAICGLQAPYAEPSLKPPGEWNHLEVQARGEVFRVGVNGREVTAFIGSRWGSARRPVRKGLDAVPRRQEARRALTAISFLVRLY